MKTIHLILAVIACSLPLSSCGNRKAKSAAAEEYVIEKDPVYNVPTEELLKRFPIRYQTPAITPQEKGIQNRMLNGFGTWNAGFDTWKAWGEVLYSPESIYVVQGVRLTLDEYQRSMDMALKGTTMELGQFENMIISGDWTAIRYTSRNINRQTGEGGDTAVMEFVHFKDYGELGMKVETGWGGEKGRGYPAFLPYQTKEEAEAQTAYIQGIVDATLPETSNLEEKYPVTYPTALSTPLAKKIKAFILSEYDAWNTGGSEWSGWVDRSYTSDVTYDWNGTVFNLAGAKNLNAMVSAEVSAKKVRIDNIIVSEDWAGVHAWMSVHRPDGSADAFDTMAFYHFVEGGNGTLKVDKCWIKENIL